MVEAIEEPNEWREFILSDPSTHPDNESDVEFEFVDGTRISGTYGAGWIWHNDRSPNVQPNSVQKWRYKPSGARPSLRRRPNKHASRAQE